MCWVRQTISLVTLPTPTSLLYSGQVQSLYFKMLRNTYPPLLTWLGSGAVSSQLRFRLIQTLLMDKVDLESRGWNLAIRNLGFPMSTE